MDALPPAAPCGVCREPAEQPFLPLCDVTGERVGAALCLSCHAVVTRWVAPDPGKRPPDPPTPG